MPGWLSRASGAIRKTPADIEEPFERSCIQCGLPLEGVRTAKPQVVSCAACSQPHFILPVSPYPPLKDPAKRKRARASKEKAGKAAASGLRPGEPADSSAAAQLPTADAQDAMTVTSTGKVDSAASPGAAAAASAGQATVAKRSGSRNTAGKKSSGRGAGQAADQLEAPVARKRLRLPAAGAAAWRLYTPVRAVVAGCLLVLLLTAWWGVRRRAMEQASVTIHLAEHSGDSALAAGRLREAAEEYARAAEAADLLDRGDMQTRRVHQKHRELVAATSLSSTSLVEILELAASRQGRGDAEWPRQLTESYAGAWFLLETAVTRSAAGSPVEVSCPLMIAGLPVQLRADLKVLQALPIDAHPQQAIFAATLLRVTAEQTPEPHWVLEFQPDSGILLTRPAVCEALGLALDEGGLVAGGQEQPLRALLARQMSWLDLDEAENRLPGEAAENEKRKQAAAAAAEEEPHHELR